MINFGRVRGRPRVLERSRIDGYVVIWMTVSANVVMDKIDITHLCANEHLRRWRGLGLLPSSSSRSSSSSSWKLRMDPKDTLNSVLP